jgi:zinc transporter ZupT
VRIANQRDISVAFSSGVRIIRGFGGFVDQLHIIMTRAVPAFLLAVVGGGLSAVVGLSHARLCALISFAAGTLLGVTVFSIVPESWEAMSWWSLLLALGSGYLVFALISKYVFHVCPACAASHFDDATTHRFREIATALVFALAIHSTMDGVALTAGWHMEHMKSTLGQVHNHSHNLDWSLLVAVCVHKVPEGLALGALLLGAGVKRLSAVLWVAAVESTTIVGGVVGLVFLGEAGNAWLHGVLAHVGGGFLFLAIHAVFGELIKHGRKVVLANFIAGVATIGIVNLLSHSH